MIRKALAMSIHPGCEAEYEERHNPIWKELEEEIRKHGVHNYSIFLHPETRQLFAYLEVEDEARWQQIAQTPICRKWWRHMSSIMPSEPSGKPLSTPLKEVFHLD